jgi:adenine C2-methylase RlmN of 23S rRNA A2503 and tRNA A37
MVLAVDCVGARPLDESDSVHALVEAVNIVRQGVVRHGDVVVQLVVHFDTTHDHDSFANYRKDALHFLMSLQATNEELRAAMTKIDDRNLLLTISSEIKEAKSDKKG